MLVVAVIYDEGIFITYKLEQFLNDDLIDDEYDCDIQKFMFSVLPDIYRRFHA